MAFAAGVDEGFYEEELEDGEVGILRVCGGYDGYDRYDEYEKRVMFWIERR